MIAKKKLEHSMLSGEIKVNRFLMRRAHHTEYGRELGIHIFKEGFGSSSESYCNRILNHADSEETTDPIEDRSQDVSHKGTDGNDKVWIMQRVQRTKRV